MLWPVHPATQACSQHSTRQGLAAASLAGSQRNRGASVCPRAQAAVEVVRNISPRVGRCVTRAAVGVQTPRVARAWEAARGPRSVVSEVVVDLGVRLDYRRISRSDIVEHQLRMHHAVLRQQWQRGQHNRGAIGHAKPPKGTRLYEYTAHRCSALARAESWPPRRAPRARKTQTASSSEPCYMLVSFVGNGRENATTCSARHPNLHRADEGLLGCHFRDVEACSAPGSGLGGFDSTLPRVPLS